MRNSSDQAFISEPRMAQQSTTSLLAWGIFFVGILYYCFAYLLRIYPGVMETELRSFFGVNAAGFSLLTSMYYLAYAPMQIPVGLSVDRIGPRKSLISACIISTLGVFLFAYFQNFALSLLGRFMIGFGAAFAYVTALKIISVWLPRQYFATATGAVTGCGMLAAIGTNFYLTQIVATHGFQHAMYFPLAAGIVLLCLIFTIIKDKPTTSNATQTTGAEMHALNLKQLGSHLNNIVKNKQMWLIGVIGTLLYLPASVFLDVWAIPYLHHVRHLNPLSAALGANIMLAGWICSSFASCALSDIFGTRKKPLVFSSCLGLIIACSILYSQALPLTVLYSLLFLFGLCCGPHPLCFTLAKENNNHAISGTAVAFANFVIMIGGFLQNIVGRILDSTWDGQITDGIRVYSTHSYQAALTIIPAGLAIAAICTYFLKETYQKST